MTPLWRLALFSLLIALVASQTPAQNVAKPSVSEDGIAITPLVSRQTERASPCGLRLFSFEPRAATSQFYLEIRFTSQSNVKFEVQLSSQGHGAASSDRCESLSHTCNTTVANQRCTLVESCHPAALWFISVRTRDLVEGFFSLDAFTYGMPFVYHRFFLLFQLFLLVNHFQSIKTKMCKNGLPSPAKEKSYLLIQ